MAFSYKERSISPSDVRHGRFKGALGDCFRTGLRPSQDCLNPTTSGSAVATPTIRYIDICHDLKIPVTFFFKEVNMAKKRHGR